MSQPADSRARTAEEILDRVAALRQVSNSDFETDDETRRKLMAHGIDDAEIARQLSTLKANTSGRTGVLTSYSLLHSLQHLDAINARSPRRPYSAEAVLTIFRCAEIAVGCMADLAERMAANLEHGNANRFIANARWRAALHELLYRISSLVIDVAPDARDGVWLDIRLSPLWRRSEDRAARLHEGLMEKWSESAGDIFAEGLDRPSRYVFFNEFVNVSDQRIWLSRLSHVRLPGVERHEDETDEAMYERLVCSDQIDLMLAALETTEETDLLPFRVVHQISEVIANTVHQHLSDVIEALLQPDGPLDQAARAFEIDNRLLSGVDDSIKMMLRSLTPGAYRAVRPNLGMVQGTSSVLLRKVLFNATYPMLVRAFRLRICGSPELADVDQVVETRARELLAEGDGSQRQLAAVLRGLVVLHEHVRTWRDNHLQLPKTHLGISPVPNQPTVSLSGSDGAVSIAHQLRRAHETDPIVPLFRAAMGTEPPAVHEIIGEGGFDEYMANQTARAVFEVYGDVQKRFLDRKRRQTGVRSAGD